MELNNKVVVVTGAGSGIGAALAHRFSQESTSALILADLDLDSVTEVANDVGGEVHQMDVSNRDATGQLIERVERDHGPIDLYCANAGYGVAGDEQDDVEAWNRMWDVNLMSHVHAAKFLLPGWLARGSGYFLSTASAAGLLTNLKAAQYSVTKHAAVAFSEWLAVTYGDRGIKVSCLCPMGVNTPFIESADEFGELLGPHLIEPEAVADATVEGIAEEKFLILPHPSVERFFQNKADDYDRWISGMQRLQQSVFGD